MTAPPNDWAPAKKAEATTNISTLNYSTSAVGLQAIGVEDIIKAIGHQAPKAPNSKAPEAGECTCELTGRCASCDRLPAVLRQRLSGDFQGQTSQTVETVNSSPSSWGSRSRQWQ